MTRAMAERPAFTLGVEEEFQIIDPESRELRSHVQEMMDEGQDVGGALAQRRDGHR